jgi:hypothetical protein
MSYAHRFQVAVGLNSSKVTASLAGACLLLGCAHGHDLYHGRDPLWRDPDRRPFEAQLEPKFMARRWDEVHHSVFRPVSQFLSVETAGEAINVNALDEVPESSWFENRIGLGRLSVSEARRGPCPAESLSSSGPWTIVGGKPNGADPGFVIEGPDDRRYLIKLDQALQGPRTSTAEVVASRIYHAAGFNVPCNTITVFERSILRLEPGATVKDARGKKMPLTWQHVARAFDQAQRLADGRYRASASLYLEGRPLGPWSYEGTLRGDRNDIVPHEDRRELRASRLLAAWTDHSDQHAQNTLAMWIEANERQGYVRHHLLDFGDCFGSIWAGPVEQARRRGHAYWFAPDQMLIDFLTLGALERPWDRAKVGPTGLVFAYYGSEDFDPEAWKPSYPNPAFSRMTESDAAWMARIIARFDAGYIDAIVSTAELEPALHAELVRVLSVRQRAILDRYLGQLSPLTDPGFETRQDGVWLCTTNLASQMERSGRNPYAARAWRAPALQPLGAPPLVVAEPGRPCVRLPDAETPAYWVLELSSRAKSGAMLPARFHVLQEGPRSQRLVGLERPEGQCAD